MSPITASSALALFSTLSSTDASTRTSFFNHVFDDVQWTVMGSSPMSKTYTSKAEFLDATLAVLGNQVLSGPLRMHPYNAVVAPPDSGGSQQVVVEMRAVDAECRNGMGYNITYCWVCTFDGETKKISQVRAYVDSELLTRAMRENKPE